MNRNSGDVVWRSLLFNSFVVGGILSFSCDRAFSQITPDDTLGDESSVVNPRDANSESIDGGAVRGQNLFHSFEEFNVGEDRGVYFANPDAVTNIFSRVTGDNISNILGTLGVDGAANLFLINPNGIVFGEGASLDVQGSFTATTADGIEFGEQGFFSAVNPTNSVLTISVPLGLQFGSNPGSIINRSFVKDSTGDFVGLQVPDGENITLVGGDINFEGGEATASGGNIEIGGLGAAGEVGFNNDSSLNFPDNVAKADLTFSNGADIDVSGTGGGNITVDAKNLTLKAGEFGSSLIRAGVRPESTNPQAQAENITINVAEKITINNSNIANQVAPEAVGNGGNIFINTNTFQVFNGGQISTGISGQGNSGEIEINATDIISFNGESYNGNPSGVFSSVDTSAEGDAGGIEITTGSLSLTNGGRINASTDGQGDAGKIRINASDTISFDGEASDGNGSGAFSQVNSEGEGKAGGIEITADSLSFTDGGQVSASTGGQGDAGKIDIKASDIVSFDGEASDRSPSGAFSQVDTETEGNAGGIRISTGSLSLTNGARIDSSTFGQGNGGRININATDAISFDGEASDGFASGAFSIVGEAAAGDSGVIKISTGSLSLTNGGAISATTFGQGNAGRININATDSISFDGEKSNSNPSGAFGEVDLCTGQKLRE